MKKTLSILMFSALVVLAGCSTSPSVAASVNGHELSTDTLTRDIHDFAHSNEFTSRLAQQGVKLTKTGPLPVSFAAQWLVSLMQNEAIALVAQQRHVVATAQEKAAAAAQFKTSQSSGAAFVQLPKRLQTRIADAAALQSALRASLKPLSSEPALAQAFQTLQADCTSKRLVGHILVDTLPQAQQVIDQVKKGSSFADVSKQVSKDTTAAAQGGLLMCEGSSQWPQLDATFRAGAEATPLGQLSAPVKTQFGYHVIEVLDLTRANAAPLLAATAQPPDPLRPLIEKFLKSAKLYVNPRFGKLQRQGGAFNILPPVAKTPKSRPSPTTSSTRPAAGASGSTPTTSTPTDTPSTTPTTAASSSTTVPAQSTGTSSTTAP